MSFSAESRPKVRRPRLMLSAELFFFYRRMGGMRGGGVGCVVGGVWGGGDAGEV